MKRKGHLNIAAVLVLSAFLIVSLQGCKKKAKMRKATPASPNAGVTAENAGNQSIPVTQEASALPKAGEGDPKEKSVEIRIGGGKSGGNIQVEVLGAGSGKEAPKTVDKGGPRILQKGQPPQAGEKLPAVDPRMGKPFIIVDGRKIYVSDIEQKRRGEADAEDDPVTGSRQSSVRIKYLDEMGIHESLSFGAIMSVEGKLTKGSAKSVLIVGRKLKGPDISDILNARNQIDLAESNACRADVSGPCLFFKGDKVYIVSFDKNNASSQTLNLAEIKFRKPGVNDETDRGCFGGPSLGCDYEWGEMLAELRDEAKADEGPVAYSRFKNESHNDRAIEQLELGDF